MPNNVGPIPEFFYPDGDPLLTKEFLEHVPDNSRIVIYKGKLRAECYVYIEDDATRQQRAFSHQYTFNECIQQLTSADMELSVVTKPKTFKEGVIKKPTISDKKVNDFMRKLWKEMENDRENRNLL